jgi:tetratricopeptide (TPR) repeat protein
MVVIQATVLLIASLLPPFVVSASSTPPLPEDINIESPLPDLPDEIKRLSGYWEGTWRRRVSTSLTDPTATLEAILVVEKVDTHSASIIYAVSDCPGWLIEKGWGRYRATFTSEGGKLGFAFEFIIRRGKRGPRGTLTFVLNDKGNLEGQSSNDFSAEVKMARKETAFAKQVPAIKGRTPEVLTRSPAPSDLRHKEQALVYAKMGQYDQALGEFGQALKIDPQDAEIYNNRGSIYTLKGQYDSSIADFNKALELNPRYAKAYYNRALAYYYQGGYDQAISDLNKTIEFHPNDVEAYHNRGLAHDQKKDYDKAISDFNMAIALKRDLADAYFNKAVTCEKAGRREEAREAYTTFLEYAPPEAKAQIEQARRRVQD